MKNDTEAVGTILAQLDELRAEKAGLEAIVAAQAGEIERLREALKELVCGYVNTLEAGRDRIMEFGGQCDPVDVMEASDPYLKSARAALSGERNG